MSTWMSSNGNKACESLKVKGEAWFFAKGQILQCEKSLLQEMEIDLICLRTGIDG